jgi:hypothetical protein
MLDCGGMDDYLKILGSVAGVSMPLFNIPLIVRVYRRKSCDDLSLWWVFGVWSCMLLMLPSALQSTDIVLKVFGISNVLLFSAVVFVVMYYRFLTPKR